MRGDLSETPAADACRQLAGDGSTGVLTVEGPEGPGTVTFVAGRIVGASSPSPRGRLGDRLVGAGFLEDEALSEALETQRTSSGRVRLGALLVERTLVPRDAIRLFVQEQALDALFEVLRWRYGSFAFLPGPAADIAEISVAMGADDALVEVSRRQDLWHELSAVIPDLECIPTLRPAPSSGATALEPDEFAVLASIDGERSVRVLAADLGYGEFELARVIYGLLLLGIVDIELPEDEIGAALDDALAYCGHSEAAVDDQPATAPELIEPDLDFFAAPRGSADAPEPTAEGPEEPAAEAASRAGPSDLPESSFSDVLRELRGLDEEATANRARPTPPPRPAAPEREQPEPEQPSSTGNDVAPPPTAAPRPTRSADDGDVSEFLRELSRLALDEQAEEPDRPRRTPPPRNDPKDDDTKRKRRGLFGRG